MLVCAPVAATLQDVPVITPTAGMTIDRSVRVKAGRYRLASPATAAAPLAPALTVRGENITIDLTDVTLEGGDPLADPDGYQGTGVFVDGGRGVTLRGGAIRGYKVGVLARRSAALHITGLDASYNWKPRLYSGIEQESLADWLSHHDNEKDEWLRYGAAIYLAECDDAEIDHTRAVQGQNGLMVTRSARAKIWNNTFSWLSGLGLGLYRTADSTIMHNKLDWDVRGYSHGFYNRGQDSAALLMYEQSSRNMVAYNSATHGGDGLFLWAGQSTMDTGQGGSNDNTFFGNDFSHAVANGIEATFSRNQFIRNRIDDCWHGVWAGYSYDTGFRDNAFAGSEDAIAIEHGQNIIIAGNTFTGDQTAIRLWANATQDPNWGYTKARDTRSRDYLIQQNAFSGQKTALNVMRTANVRVQDNAYVNTGVPLLTGVDVTGLLFEPPATRTAVPPVADVPRLAGAEDAMLPLGTPRGRQTIIVDEWGPYDYQSPKVWPADTTIARPLKLRVLGSAGQVDAEVDPRRNDRAQVWQRARCGHGHASRARLGSRSATGVRRRGGNDASRPRLSSRRDRAVLLQSGGPGRRLGRQVVGVRRGVRSPRGAGRLRGTAAWRSGHDRDAAAAGLSLVGRAGAGPARRPRGHARRGRGAGARRRLRPPGAERRRRAGVGGRRARGGPLVSARDPGGPRRAACRSATHQNRLLRRRRLGRAAGEVSEALTMNPRLRQGFGGQAATRNPRP